MLRPFSETEKQVIKKITTDKNYSSLPQLVTSALEGYKITKETFVSTAGFVIGPTTSIFIERITQDESPIDDTTKLEIEAKVITVVNLLKYLRQHDLIYIYDSHLKKEKKKDSNHRVIETPNESSARVLLSDDSVRELLDAYWEKRFVPTEVLKELSDNAFITAEKANERKNNRFTLTSIVISMVLGIVTVFFQAMLWNDRKDMIASNNERTAILKSEIEKLNHSLDIITRKSLADSNVSATPKSMKAPSEPSKKELSTTNDAASKDDC